MSEKKDNPYMSIDTCIAYRELLEEKINGIKSMVKLTGAVITLILGAIQVLLTLVKG